MELVLDANILFAAIIKDSKTTELLLDPRLNLFLHLQLCKKSLK